MYLDRKASAGLSLDLARPRHKHLVVRRRYRWQGMMQSQRIFGTLRDTCGHRDNESEKKYRLTTQFANHVPSLFAGRRKFQHILRDYQLRGGCREIALYADQSDDKVIRKPWITDCILFLATLLPTH
jgi:hypothetical protein